MADDSSKKASGATPTETYPGKSNVFSTAVTGQEPTGPEFELEGVTPSPTPAIKRNAPETHER